jgi:hypothetical protein
LSVASTLSGSQYPDLALYQLIRAAAMGLPPVHADDLATLASYQGEIRPALLGAVETLRMRARIHDAFADLPPP